MKKLLSLTLALCLCLSLALPATAAGYTYNWGTREQLATSLSPAAESFYTPGHTYEDFLSLPGSGNLSQVPETPLYEALQEFMTDNHTHQTDYQETRYQYIYTDCQNSSPTAISCFYSGMDLGPEWDYGRTWNREHTWPQSKGGSRSEPSGADIMSLRPTESSINGGRGNRAYGESSNFYNPNGSTDTYDIRGDVARVLLYTYVRWGEPDHLENMWGASGVIESKAVLLKWMAADPVDTWELGRNDAVQSITGTRNVFVDYPELAFRLFGEAIPTDMATPSGQAQNQPGVFSITALYDESQGSVSILGNRFTVLPAPGYALGEITLISGTADLDPDGAGGVATSHCTLSVTFVPQAQTEVRFLENGSASKTLSALSGESLTLPAPAAAAPEGAVFLGWTATAVSSTATAPVWFPAGSAFSVPAAGATFHALYLYSQPAAAGSTYALTDSLTDGAQVLIFCPAQGQAMTSDIASKYYKKAAPLTPEDGLVDAPAANLIWTLRSDGDGFQLVSSTGQRLSIEGSYNSIPYDQEYDAWTAVAAQTPGQVYLQNETGKYLVWDSKYKNFSAANQASEDLLAMELYVLSADVTYSTGQSAPVTPGQPGDVDTNGRIDNYDLLLLLYHINRRTLLPQAGQQAADITADGTIDIWDLQQLILYLNHRIDHLT